VIETTTTREIVCDGENCDARMRSETCQALQVDTPKLRMLARAEGWDRRLNSEFNPEIGDFCPSCAKKLIPVTELRRVGQDRYRKQNRKRKQARITAKTHK
jgi:hypothetical protein